VMLHTTFTSVSVVPPFSPPWTFVVRSGLKPNSQTVATPVPDPTWTENPPVGCAHRNGSCTIPGDCRGHGGLVRSHKLRPAVHYGLRRVNLHTAPERSIVALEVSSRL